MRFFQYGLGLLIGFIFATIAFTSAVIYQMGSPVPSSRWIYELNQLKTGYLTSIQTPKIILVSGSNTLYGISCQTLEKKLKRPCVNTALTQELGLDYILDHARQIAQPKDTILLPLEYQLYITHGTPSELLLDYIIAYQPSYFESMNLLQKIRLIMGVSPQRLFQGILAKGQSLSSLTSSYQSRITPQGDSLDNLKITNKNDPIINGFQPFNLQEYQISSYSREQLSQFIVWCRDHQINLISTWPSTVDFSEYQDPKTQEFFQSIKHFYTQAKVPVLGTPEDFMYNKFLFYNSVYHLNDQGRQQRTQKIITLIEPYLK
ncbi:conserved exported hypothetical protein [Planktothrix serta PCC 8927]|uniref:DUF1574 domain-containing protein n=1 Tax=Planktothrix serta PCC 8927 TaxID=671068 RepID=A0A7Z9E2C8_9CYAN|nr:hypothetical protein [Planktothrix serta]VXD23803.1 conserved exported hypothetical protein [Planktothrix serta PCC 8927]